MFFTGLVGILKGELYIGTTSNLRPKVTYYTGKKALQQGLIFIILFGLFALLSFYWFYQEELSLGIKFFLFGCIEICACITAIISQRFYRKMWKNKT